MMNKKDGLIYFWRNIYLSQGHMPCEIRECTAVLNLLEKLGAKRKLET